VFFCGDSTMVLPFTWFAVLDPSATGLYVCGMANAKKKRKAVLLGVGLDSDGHKRLTTGPNFALVGGSEETHEVMTEKAIKINEKPLRYVRKSFRDIRKWPF
jgi:hypothetical protein